MPSASAPPASTRRSGVGLPPLLGLAAGLASGLFGVGGGAVIVPGLVLVVGLAEHAAFATSLAAIVLIAPAALASFVLEGTVNWGAAGVLLAGGTVGALVGARLVAGISGALLRKAFAALLLLVGARLVLGVGLAAGGAEVGLTPGRLAGLVTLGLVAGLVSSALGVGGGVVLVPALVLLFGVAQHLAEGTSLAVIAPTALIGAWRHGRRGATDWRLGLVIGAGGVVGGLFGAQLALALPAAALGRLFGAFLLVTGVRMLRGGRS